MSSPSLDEIGYWSEVKLEIIQKYATAYSTIMAHQRKLRHVYIDAFAGAGQNVSKRAGGAVAGSPHNALEIAPPFGEFHLIDLHGEKVEALQRLAGRRKDVFIHRGDANSVLLEHCLTQCRYEDY